MNFLKKYQLKKLLKKSPFKSIQDELAHYDSYLENLHGLGIIDNIQVKEIETLADWESDNMVFAVTADMECEGKIIKMDGVGEDNNKCLALIKAYSEFIERIYYFSAGKQKISGFSYPEFQTSQIETDIFSSTNGMACHSNLGKACLNAYLELLERHYVLLDWYTRTTPIRIRGYINPVFDGLKSYLRSKQISVNILLHSQHKSCFVVSMIAKSEVENNFMYLGVGLGAHSTIEGAIQKAYRELCRIIEIYRRSDASELHINELPDEAAPIDHSYYYQSFKRSNHVEFLIENNPQIDISELQKKDRAMSLEFLEDLTRGIHPYFFPLNCCPELFPENILNAELEEKGIYVVNARCKDLLGIHFGSVVDETDLTGKIIKVRPNKYTHFSIPHPIA